MEGSRNLLLFVASREALVLTAYQDGWQDEAKTIPLYSIGFGHSDPNLKPGDTITPRQAFQQLREDIRLREGAVNRALKVQVSQNQFDALLDLYFQGGSDGLKAVSALVNAKAPSREIATEFLKWDTNKAGDHFDGLLARRAREVVMYLTGDYGELRKIPFYKGNPKKTQQTWYELKEGDVP